MSAQLRPPSQHALDMVGKSIKWSQGDKDPVDALVIGAERTLSIIRTAEGEEFPGVRFRIKLANGRQRWTVTFADRGAA